MPEPKEILTLRVPPAANKLINDVAASEGVARALVSRAMLSVASHHMPEVLKRIRDASALDRMEGDEPPLAVPGQRERRATPKPGGGKK